MQIGSSNFEAYNKTLRRVMWGDWIDEQMRIAREQQYRASLVEQPYQDQHSIVGLTAALHQISDGKL